MKCSMLNLCSTSCSIRLEDEITSSHSKQLKNKCSRKHSICNKYHYKCIMVIPIIILAGYKFQLKEFKNKERSR